MIRADERQAVRVPVSAASGEAAGAGPAGEVVSLVGGGFLRRGFRDSNGFGQQTAVVIRRIPGALRCTVETYGGAAIPPRTAERIAANLGHAAAAAVGGLPAVRFAAVGGHLRADLLYTERDARNDPTRLIAEAAVLTTGIAHAELPVDGAAGNVRGGK